MDLVAEVQAGDGRTLASQPLRLFWRQARDAGQGDAAKLQSRADVAPAVASVAPSAKVREIDPAEVAALLKRAEALMSNGDLPAARLLLQRISETHNARAAYDLATTYDPDGDRGARRCHRCFRSRACAQVVRAGARLGRGQCVGKA